LVRSHRAGGDGQVFREFWLFIATPAGGRRAAILLSLTASAKANQVEPRAWLQNLFTRLPQLPDHPTDDDLAPSSPTTGSRTTPTTAGLSTTSAAKNVSGEQPRPCISPNGHTFRDLPVDWQFG
jgi:hypothetical protein